MEKGTVSGGIGELEPRARSITTASNLFRRKLCNGSAWAEFELPELETSGAAEFGTEMHAYESDELDPELLTESFKRTAIEKNAAITNDFLEGLAFPIQEVEVLREHRFFARHEDGTVMATKLKDQWMPLTGQADEVRWFTESKWLVIFDSKFGRFPVTQANMNTQLRLYALMAFDHFKGEPLEIYVAIRQPYLKSPDDFHAARYTREQMPAVRREIENILLASEALDATRAASPEACRFCRARGTTRCPESVALATSIARQRIANLVPQELEKLAPMIAMARSVCDAWTERMKMIAKTYPALLKEHELVPTGETSKVDTVAAYNELFASSILGDRLHEVFLASCKLSLPKLCANAAKMFKDEGLKDDAEFKVMCVLQHLIDKTPKEKRLAKK